MSANHSPVLRLVLCLATVTLSSCAGGNPPSDEQAKQAWLKGRGNQITAEQPSELVSFKKTKGTASQDYGAKFYEFQYEATLKCKGNSHSATTEPGECKPGQLVVNRGSMTFKMTDNGWEYARY
jgi:hypothetical protein